MAPGPVATAPLLRTRGPVEHQSRRGVFLVPLILALFQFCTNSALAPQRHVRFQVQPLQSSVGNASMSGFLTDEEVDIRRLRRAESVLRQRVGSNLTVVLESAANERNQDAVLRTCEALGVQNVWVIRPNRTKIQHPSNLYTSSYISKSAARYLSIQWYFSSADCARDLKRQGFEIWATDLSSNSEDLTSLLSRQAKLNLTMRPACVNLTSVANLNSTHANTTRVETREERRERRRRRREERERPFPEKLAIIFGSETTGVSKEICAWADRRVYYPLYGFTESLNLGVAAGVVLSTILNFRPNLRASVTPQETQQLRSQWYMGLARTKKQQATFPKYLQNPPPPLHDSRATSRGEPRVFPRYKPKARTPVDPPVARRSYASASRLHNLREQQSQSTNDTSAAQVAAKADSSNSTSIQYSNPNETDGTSSSKILAKLTQGFGSISIDGLIPTPEPTPAPFVPTAAPTLPSAHDPFADVRAPNRHKHPLEDTPGMYSIEDYSKWSIQKGEKGAGFRALKNTWGALAEERDDQPLSPHAKKYPNWYNDER